MKVKDLKSLFDNFDEDLHVFLQVKDERGWGLYNVFAFSAKDIALQDNEGTKYVALGDVLKKGEAGCCSFDGSKISG
jgi:hypothetical protein